MLDELGQEIIHELQEDARQSFREIGRKLKVSEGTVRNRVRNMLSSNMIKISALPNPQQLGLNFMCIMGIEVKVGAAERVEQLLIDSPNVYYLCGCTGAIDIIGIFVFRVPAEFDEFVKNLAEAHAGLLSGLGIKAGRSHTGNRIGFQHIQLLIFKDHIGPAVTLAEKGPVSNLGVILRSARQFFTNAGRTYFLGSAGFVFSFIVKEFIAFIRYDLDQRQGVQLFVAEHPGG